MNTQHISIHINCLSSFHNYLLKVIISCLLTLRIKSYDTQKNKSTLSDSSKYLIKLKLLNICSFSVLYLDLRLHQSVLCSLVCVNNPWALCLPCSSQYGWRGSGMSMGDGVLDSGKASDLSVCSWPVEPIHWTPFPLLQQLASHRNPAVSV